MRYEKPECVLLGEAKEVVLGEFISPVPENEMSSDHGELVGYDE